MRNKKTDLIAYIGHRRLRIYPHIRLELTKLMDELAPSIRDIVKNRFSDIASKYEQSLDKIQEANHTNEEIIDDEQIKEMLGSDSRQFFQDIDFLYVDLVFSNPYVIEYYKLFGREEIE